MNIVSGAKTGVDVEAGGSAVSCILLEPEKVWD
jgi:hypothetical protein